MGNSAIETEKYLYSSRLLKRNLLDENYFEFFFKIHYKRGFRHLLNILEEVRIKIVDMLRISSILQKESGVGIFFYEYCESLITYAQQIGAHKVRKMTRINLNLIKQDEWNKVMDFQSNYQKALKETEKQIAMVIEYVEELSE